MIEGRRFVKKGNVVVMKEEVKPREFSSKDILDNIDQMTGMIDKARADIAKNLADNKVLEAEASRLGDILKDVKKHESWAIDLQHSRLKALVEEHWSLAVKAVEKDYNVDNVLDQYANNRQRYSQLQAKIGRHPAVAKEISSRLIRDEVFGSELLVSPWQLNPLE